jgi:glycosyltransferase involved in cell wall biosynthesis
VTDNPIFMHPKILFVVTEDWYFCSHRLPLAVAAKEAGFDVVVATRISDHEKVITDTGIRVIPLKRMLRSSLNIFRELSACFELFSIYRRERPALVHHVAIKPIIYGSLAARIFGIRAKVNSLGGLGFVFSSDSKLAGILRPVLINIFRLIFNGTHSRLILQNRDDLTLMTDKAKVREQNVRLIRGAGVDLGSYVGTAMPIGVPIAMLASRMLWDKGVGEFVSAAKHLIDDGVQARFVLVGQPDPENPSSISEKQLKEWSDCGVIEWWGHHKDMPQVLSQANVVCLPTYYREGVPRVLIEAMACARPIVTTDVPGCRDLVKFEMNGILVPPRDAIGLASALRSLLLDRPRCQKMGNEGRQIAEKEYSLSRVVCETLAVYEELL